MQHKTPLLPKAGLFPRGSHIPHPTRQVRLIALMDECLDGRQASRDWTLGMEAMSQDPGIQKLALHGVRLTEKRSLPFGLLNPRGRRIRSTVDMVRREAPIVALGAETQWREAAAVARAHDLLSPEDQPFFREYVAQTQPKN
jgi:hypothetical protein